MKNKISLLLLVLVLGIAFFLRVYLLGIVPPGLTNDEADIGYDAYSILLTGKDQWGETLPLIAFKGFGDYRLPLYTYLVIPSEKIFGVTPFAVRFPSALFGTLSVGLIFFLARKLFEKTGRSRNVIGFVTAAFMAVSPWSVGLSRIGIESNVAICFFLGAFLSFLYSLKYQKLIFLSSFLFVLTLYMYTAYTLFTPLVLLALFFFFKKQLSKNKKSVILSLLLFIVLVTPLFITRSAAGVRASQVSLINNQDSIGTLANLNDRRGSCSEKYPSIICKLTENKQVVILNTFFKNYLNHFSFSLLFLNGSTTQYSILPPRGLFYAIELLFFISGLVGIIIQKNKAGYLAFVLLLISAIPDSITGEGHYSRASAMMPFVFILEGFGLLYLWNYLLSLPKTFSFVIKTTIFIIMFFSVASFLISYLSYFPKYYSIYSQYGYEAWSNKIYSAKNSYNKIFLSKYGNDTKQYIYYLFYTKYNPVSFQEKRNVSFSNDADGWVSISRIDNLYFVDRIPSEEYLRAQKNKNILLVSHPNEFSKLFELKNMTQIRDKNNNGIFVFVNASSLLEFYKKGGMENKINDSNK